jgi:hypothetical protein
VSGANTISITIGNHFFSDAAKLHGTDAKRVHQAIDRFLADPSHPSLNFEKLHAGDGRLWSLRVSDKVRILLAREGSTYMLLEVGQHDDIYDRVSRGSFRVVPTTGFVGVVNTAALDQGTGSTVVHRLVDPIVESESGVLDHWSDADLHEAGFSEVAVQQLRTARTEELLVELDLPSADIERAIDIMELTPEQWRAPTLLADVNIAEQRLRSAIESFGAAHGLSPFFTPEQVAQIAAAPIEDWMIFLHPDQRSVVTRRYEGPARVRGAAGTGKTVVALHRAAELAHRFAAEGDDKKILFTTFIKTLPPVFESLYRRLPNALPGAVEFVHVDKLAYRIVGEDLGKPRLNGSAIKAAYARAFAKVVVAGSPLARAGVTRDYLKAEITKVIKGRAIASLEEYLAIERTGRRVRFNEALRTQTWRLMEAWYAEMGRRDTVDFADVLLLARDAAERRPEPTYRAAIVDEAQDLTLVGLQMIRALLRGTGDEEPSDALLLVGDGAQRVYPGCFTLKQAGIDVVGRSTILRTNYRNTAEILGAAMAVAGDEPVDDLDEQYTRADEGAVSERSSGVRPVLVECAGKDDEHAFLLRRIRELIDGGNVGLADLGIFVPTNREVSATIGLLRSAQLQATDLTSWDGRPSKAIRVGTYHRAKGLEFKVVFLPGLDESFPRAAARGQDPDEHLEQRALEISQLFVAMTRPRDALFISTPGSPSEVLVEHLDAFDVVQS